MLRVRHLTVNITLLYISHQMYTPLYTYTYAQPHIHIACIHAHAHTHTHTHIHTHTCVHHTYVHNAHIDTHITTPLLPGWRRGQYHYKCYHYKCYHYHVQPTPSINISIFTVHAMPPHVTEYDIIILHTDMTSSLFYMQI